MERFDTIVVVGGGCYGSYYVRQLGRASRAGAIAYERLVVVDRDPGCALSRPADVAAGPPPELVVREWRDFFGDYLDRAARTGETRDAIVPSPLMPHLMYEWLLQRARARWPERAVETRPIGADPPVPWQRAAPDGTHYVSFAEWTCPINCVEPRTCPITRSARTWSLPPAVRAFVDAERAHGRNLAGPVIFHCRHRAYGVGMFDTREVLDGDRVVRAAGERGSAEILIGTVSHCHGALNVLAVGA